MTDYSVDELLKEAKQKMGIDAKARITWRAGPQMFPTTAGPRKGMIAGQAFTEFQVFIFENPYNTSVGLMFCGGMWKDWQYGDGLLW